VPASGSKAGKRATGRPLRVNPLKTHTYGRSSTNYVSIPYR